MIGLLSRYLLFFLNCIYEIGKNQFIEFRAIVTFKSFFECLNSLSESNCFLLFFSLACLLILFVFFTSQLVAVSKLVVSVFEEIVPIIDDVLICSKAFFKLLVASTEFRVITIAIESELLLLFTNILYVIFKVVGINLKVIVTLFFWKVQFLVYKILYEGEDIALQEEGVPKASFKS